MRNRNLNAEITGLRAALAATARGMHRAAQAANEADSSLRAPPAAREATGVERAHRAAQTVAAPVG